MTAPHPEAMSKAEAWDIYKRARVTAGLCAPEWVRIFDQKEKQAQIGVTDPLDGLTTPIASVARKVPYDDEDLLFHAPLYLRAAVTIAEGALAEIERLKHLLSVKSEEDTRRSQANDLSRQCAMLCRRADFARYLKDRHGLMDAADDLRVATRLRSILNIQSRAELNSDPDAAARWRSLLADFDAWRKAG